VGLLDFLKKKKEDAPASGGVTIKVGPRDTLKSLARKYYDDETVWTAIYDKNKWRIEYQILNVADLSDMPNGHAVSLEDLIVSGAINKNRPLKILGDGELTVNLTIEAHKFSASARSKIEAAGGSVVEIPWVVERRSRSAGPNPAMRNRKAADKTAE